MDRILICLGPHILSWLLRVIAKRNRKTRYVFKGEHGCDGTVMWMARQSEFSLIHTIYQYCQRVGVRLGA